MKVVIGLGNPGSEYAHTRHNVGFVALESLRAGERWRREGSRECARVEIAGRSTWLVRPLTYMNRSGEAVAPFLAALGIAPEECLVVCDDVTLPWGRLRLRGSGGAGGHNGLKSVIGALGTNAFPRLRVGVGAPPPGMDLADFVLQPLDPEGWEALSDLARAAVAAVESVQRDGLAEAMNRINPGPPAEETPAI